MNNGDWRRRPRNTLPKIMERVDKQANGCWVWTGFITPQGYGACGYRGRRHTLAHRVVYQELVGPIPDGLTLDHLCHTNDHGCSGGNSCLHRRCVNPEHLEPVTFEENNSRGVFARKTHCPAGHPYSGENLGITKAGGRFCRECGRQKAREHHRLRSLGLLVKTRVIRNPRPLLSHCKRGHAFDETNTLVLAGGERRCRACNRERARIYAAQKRGAA